MEEMFAGFAAHRQAAGIVRTRPQAALHRRADRDVLVLNLLADRDAVQVGRTRGLRHIREVEVEDHLGPVHTSRDDQVRVHRATVAVDHEVRDRSSSRRRARPVAPRGALSAPSLTIGLDCRQKRSPFVDRVFAVVEDAVEPLVEMRHVIAAVEIVVDEHLPVAVEGVRAPLHPVQASSASASKLTEKVARRETPRSDGPPARA